MDTVFVAPCITADYAKGIQDERSKLIKAMFKAKEQGSEAKVVGRYLYIGELKYDVINIPEDFKSIKERTYICLTNLRYYWCNTTTTSLSQIEAN